MEKYLNMQNISWLIKFLNATQNKMATRQRPPLYHIPPSITILLFVAYGAICILALIGNGLVLYLVLPKRRMWTVTNLFLVNLAVADIIISIFTIPFQFQAALSQRWDLPNFLCPICPFVQALSVLVSVLTLSAIAMQRCKAVMYPFAGRTSKVTACLVIVFIWIVAILLSLPTYMDYKVRYHRFLFGAVLTPQCLRTYLSKQVRWYYSLSLILAQYFVPFVIITGAYTRMGYLLCRGQTPGNFEAIRDPTFEMKKRRAAKVMSGVVLVFALCWFPYQTYQIVMTFYPGINNYHYINIIWFGMHWLAMSNSCCNPFIYAIYNDTFQAEFRARNVNNCLYQRCCAVNHRNGNNRNNFEMNRGVRALAYN